MSEPDDTSGVSLSRLCRVGGEDEQETGEQLQRPQTARNYLRQVHGGRMPHYGAKRTWKLLNKHFSGHQVPVRVVQYFVAECPRCQKDAHQLVNDIQPAVWTLLPGGNRERVGIDSVTITPADKDGNV